MTRLQSRAILSRALKHWPSLLLASTALAWFIWTVYFTNQYGFYSLNHWAYGIPLAGFIFLALTAWNALFIVKRIALLSTRVKTALLTAAALAAAVLYALVPPPQLALSQVHQLRISPILASRVEPAAAAIAGKMVEITQIKFADGQKIDPERIQLSGDWQISASALFSQSQPASTLELNGPMPAGVVVSLKYSPNGGLVRISWDGASSDYDLYSPTPSTSNIILKGLDWQLLSLPQQAVYLITIGLYYLALLTGALLLFLLLRFGQVKPHWAILALLYLACFGAYLNQKASYNIFATERVYRDSQSYLRAAELPLNSLDFWAGERPFSVPLMYKLLGVSASTPDMAAVARFQMGLSIFSWGMFALAVSAVMRQRWLKPSAFGLLLFFSLSLEVALWDQLMLSESLSNSLFVLLLAGWIAGLSLSAKTARSIWAVALIILTTCVAILYTFTRDGNVYFVLIAAGMLTLGIIFRHIPRHLVTQCIVYISLIALLYLGQSYSLSAGNRWQIFIYDHLSMHLLGDPQSLAFFTQAGLPVSDKLLSVTQVINVRYQEMMIYDSDLAPIRQWVTQHGKMVYLQYLLLRPLASLWAPFQNSGELLNQSIADYIAPRFLPLSIPSSIQQISALLYSFNAWTLVVMTLLLISGSLAYWLRPRAVHPIWLVLSILTISLYPLMFVVWHGDPMEIPRHALQIGLQLRLGGWTALLLLVDLLFSTIWFKHLFDLEQDKTLMETAIVSSAR